MFTLGIIQQKVQNTKNISLHSYIYHWPVGFKQKTQLYSESPTKKLGQKSKVLINNESMKKSGYHDLIQAKKKPYPCHCSFHFWHKRHLSYNLVKKNVLKEHMDFCNSALSWWTFLIKLGTASRILHSRKCLKQWGISMTNILTSTTTLSLLVWSEWKKF